MGAVIEERSPSMAEIRAAVQEALGVVERHDTRGYWDIDAGVIDTFDFDVEAFARALYRRLAK